MKAISLFSGGGGFELGFDRAGIETVLQAENDPWCLQVLKRHWPDTERVTDVRAVGSNGEHARGEPADDVRERAGSSGGKPGQGYSRGIDLIYGGFPCQDVSVAGKRAGFSGERSSLWHEFHRVLRELRPRWTVIENVPGLLSSNSGRDFATVLLGLEDLGYGWAYRILDARFFGVPQRRRRVFVVGCLGDAHSAAQVLAVCESCGGHPQARGEEREDIAPTLDDGARRASVDLPMIAMNNGQGEPNVSTDGTAFALQGDAHSYVADERSVTAFDWQSGEEGDESFRGGSRAYRVRAGDYAGALSGTRVDAVFGSQVDDGAARPLVARASGYRMDMETENFVVAGALRASDGHHGHSSPRGDGGDNLIAFQSNAGSRLADELSEDHFGPVRNGAAADRSGSTGVRRLTPLECERLMGWPDDWTRYAADGRELPDSHRYRICGNGVVSTCAEWIGHRLMMADAFMASEAAA